MKLPVAHIVQTATDAVTAAMIIVPVAVVLIIALAIYNHVVKYGEVRWGALRRNVAVTMAMLGASIMLTGAGGQPEPVAVGLPDLVSEPPLPWFTKLIVDEGDGTTRKVVAFDGFIRNAGPGMLDLQGNPQQPGGVVQRIYDGSDWVAVGTPTVRYEVDDGHNHFHLIAAAEYELWNTSQTAKVEDGSKVGFCLIDTTRFFDAPLEAQYTLEDTSYCEADNPDAEELHMGITPGWADLYDANTTLQWVDISDTAPGWYWIGAKTDPTNAIVEADESNNGLVFSKRSYAVTGYRALELPVQASGEEIVLQATAFGQTGDLVWRIVEEPAFGTLSVPAGVDFFGSSLRYTAAPDAPAVDRFTVVARDVDSQFPLEPTPVEVVVETAGFALTPTETAGEPALAPLKSRPMSGVVGDYLEFDAVSLDDLPRPADRWYSADLPLGLRIDETTGTIAGVPVSTGNGQATVYALAGSGSVMTTEIAWTIVDSEGPAGLVDTNNLHIEAHRGMNFMVGAEMPDASYVATGLPDGLQMTSARPQISGIPTEIGTFAITISERVDGEERRLTAFDLTVRPSATPRFAL